MILEQIFKCTIKFLVIFRIPVAAEPVIPLNPGCQRTAGNIGRTYVNLAVICIMKDIRFWMKRPILFIIKSKIHKLSQLMLDQIQGRWLRNAKIISSQNADLRSALHSLFQFFQKHFHTGFHQKRDNDIDAIRLAHAVDQLIIQIPS